MGKYLLGEFEHLVMLAIMGLGDEAYGVSITDALGRRTGKEVAQAATYLTLRRLEEKGWVAGSSGDGSAERGGRVKRYFRVTPEGATRLRESRDTLVAMWDAAGELG